MAFHSQMPMLLAGKLMLEYANSVYDYLPSTWIQWPMTGDKKGEIAMWRIQGGGGNEAEEAKSSFPIHSEYISSLQWLGGNAAHEAVTTSYDGSVRVLDLNAESFELVGGLPDDIEISSMSCASNGR